MKKRIHKAEIILITLTAAMLCGCGKTNTDTTERNDASGIAGTEALEQEKLEYASTEPADVAEDASSTETLDKMETEAKDTETENEELSLKEQIEQEVEYYTQEITVTYAETAEYPALAEFLISYFEIPQEYQAESRYYYNYVDLNEDGINEILALVVGDYTTGSGGDTVLLIEDRAEGFSVAEAFYMVRTPVLISDNITNGWHDLIFPVYGGGNEAGYSICHYSETGTYMSEANEFVEELDNTISGQQILSNNLIDDMDKGTYLTLVPAE